MIEPQPTAADSACAKEIFRELSYSTAFAQERVIAALIARHVAEQTAQLRAEIDRQTVALGDMAIAESDSRAVNAELLAACKAVKHIIDGPVITRSRYWTAAIEMNERNSLLIGLEAAIARAEAAQKDGA